MKETRQRGKESILGSLKGKVLIMGGISLAASFVLGSVGISSLNRNNTYNQVLETVNDINIRQYENQSLETSYLYFLDDSYLDQLMDNLKEMQEEEAAAKGLAGGAYGKAMESAWDITEKCQENYGRLKELSSERGFTLKQGKYAEFVSGDETLDKEFQAVMDDKSRLDGSWGDVVIQEKTTVEGTEYDRYTYAADVPKEGKRDYFFIRLGGKPYGLSGKNSGGGYCFFRSKRK